MRVPLAASVVNCTSTWRLAPQSAGLFVEHVLMPPALRLAACHHTDVQMEISGPSFREPNSPSTLLLYR